jgi:hypothetical protein
MSILDLSEPYLTLLENQAAMSETPIAHIKRASYENVMADCPWCGEESIFNRASDFRTFELVFGRDVLCLNIDCHKPFRIVSDSINPPDEMLIFDCYELVEHKHYMNCILSLTQAYEIFFSLFFRVELLYKPFWADPDRECDALNALAEKLHKKIKNHAFDSMRNLFLWYLMKRCSLMDLEQARCVIKELPKEPKALGDTDIETFGDAKLVPLLKALRETTIHKLRNRIVHKEAYRPTREEAVSAIEQTQAILFPLTCHLDLRDDDINTYMS